MQKRPLNALKQWSEVSRYSACFYHIYNFNSWLLRELENYAHTPWYVNRDDIKVFLDAKG